jgi:urease accessory protein
MPADIITTTMMIDLLRLLAWLSPAFPTGAYAYSHGVEWAVENGDITDGATLHAWLSEVLAHGSGWNDAILLRHAHRAAADRDALGEIADLAAAVAPSRERQAETLDQGTAFVAAAAAWHPPELPARVAYPVAVGALAGWHGIAEDVIAAAYLQAFAANLISSAVRLVPLGQSAGLRVLAALEPVVLRVAEDARTATIDDLGGCAFRSDLAAMCHETQYTRLFRS